MFDCRQCVALQEILTPNVQILKSDVSKPWSRQISEEHLQEFSICCSQKHGLFQPAKKNLGPQNKPNSNSIKKSTPKNKNKNKNSPTVSVGRDLSSCSRERFYEVAAGRSPDFRRHKQSPVAGLQVAQAATSRPSASLQPVHAAARLPWPAAASVRRLCWHFLTSSSELRSIVMISEMFGW